MFDPYEELAAVARIVVALQDQGPVAGHKVAHRELLDARSRGGNSSNTILSAVIAAVGAPVVVSPDVLGLLSTTSAAEVVFLPGGGFQVSLIDLVDLRQRLAARTAFANLSSAPEPAPSDLGESENVARARIAGAALEFIRQAYGPEIRDARGGAMFRTSVVLQMLGLVMATELGEIPVQARDARAAAQLVADVIGALHHQFNTACEQVLGARPETLSAVAQEEAPPAGENQAMTRLPTTRTKKTH